MQACRTIPLRVAMALMMICASDPAFAHHMMGGQVPRTAWQGLLSGLGHPVIGLDHFAFIIGVGLLASLAGRIFLLPGVFIGGTLAGASLHLAGANIPFVELAVAASVLAIGVAVFFQRHGPVPLAAMLLGAGGLLHGYAYAESIFGAEPTPLYAYLLGFCVVQYVIAAGVALLLARLADRCAVPQVAAFRAAGLAIAAVGLTMTAGLL